MKILEEIQKQNPRNEVVGLKDMVKINSRMTFLGAMKNWSSNIRMNSLLEVVMKLVDRVDTIWTERSELQSALSEPAEIKGSTPVVTEEVWTALLSELSDLRDRVDFLSNKVCKCSTEPVALGDIIVGEVVPDQPVAPKRRGRPAATETKE